MQQQSQKYSNQVCGGGVQKRLAFFFTSICFQLCSLQNSSLLIFRACLKSSSDRCLCKQQKKQRIMQNSILTLQYNVTEACYYCTQVQLCTSSLVLLTSRGSLTPGPTNWSKDRGYMVCVRESILQQCIYTLIKDTALQTNTRHSKEHVPWDHQHCSHEIESAVKMTFDSQSQLHR